MTEYIEREALIAEFKRRGLGEYSLPEKLFTDGVYALIETCPAADAAPVVHCKDCKNWNSTECALDYAVFEPTPDSFCSYGERKD